LNGMVGKTFWVCLHMYTIVLIRPEYKLPNMGMKSDNGNRKVDSFVACQFYHSMESDVIIWVKTFR
jgi:hypothetical protein